MATKSSSGAGTGTKLSAGVLALALIATGIMEGTGYTPYRDKLAGGIWTVCQGHTGFDIDPNKTYSPAECEALLLKDWEAHEYELDRCLPPGVALTDGERIGYTDLLFNIGPGRQGRSGVCIQKSGAPSSIMRNLAAGRRFQACQSIELFVYAGGRDCRDPANKCGGLPKRRALQRQVCTGELTPHQFCVAVAQQFGGDPAACRQ